MTEPAVSTPAPAPAAKVEPKSGVPESTMEGDLQSRMNDVMERARAERSDAGEEPSEEEAPKAKEAATEISPEAETRADRIKRMAAEDSARYEAKKADREQRKRLQDAESKATKGSAAEQELAALKAQIADEGWLMKQVERHVKPDAFGDLVMRQQSPEYIAEQQAKAVAKPIQDRLEALERENADLKASRERDTENARAHQEVEQGKTLVKQTLEGLGEKASISAAMLAKKPLDYWKLVDRAAIVLHEQGKLVSAETVTLHVENTLAELFGLRESVVEAAAPLTNKAASERATLSEDGEGLSFRQRLERTQRAVRAGR